MENISVWTEALDELNAAHPDIDWQVYRIKTPSKAFMLFIAHRDGISPCYIGDETTTRKLIEDTSMTVEIRDIGHHLVDTLDKAIALEV